MQQYLLCILAAPLLLALFPANTQAQDAEWLSLTVGNRWVYDFREGNTDILDEEKQPIFAHTRKRNTCVLEIVGDTVINGESAAIVALTNVPRKGDIPVIGDRFYWAKRDSALVQYGTYACYDPFFSAKWLWYENLENNPAITLSDAISFCLKDEEPVPRSIGASSFDVSVAGQERATQRWSHSLLALDGGTLDHYSFTPQIGILEFGLNHRWRNSSPTGFLATLRGAVIDGIAIGDTSLAIDTVKAPQVNRSDLECLLQTGNRWVFNHSVGKIGRGHRVNYPKIPSPNRVGMTSLEVIGDTVLSVFVRDTLRGDIQAAIVEARNFATSDGVNVENRRMFWTIIGNNFVELQDRCYQESPSRAFLWNDSLAQLGLTTSVLTYLECPLSNAGSLGPAHRVQLEPIEVFGDTRVSQIWTRIIKLNSDGNSEVERYVFSPNLGPIIHVTSTSELRESGVTSVNGSYTLLAGAVVCGKVYGDTTITSIGDHFLPARDVRVSILPTPFQNDLQLAFDGAGNHEFTIRLHDLQGRTVHQEQHAAFSLDEQHIDLELGTLESGMFLLTIETGGTVVGRATVIKAP